MSNYSGNLLFSVILTIVGTIINYIQQLFIALKIFAPAPDDRVIIIFYLQCLAFLGSFGIFVVTLIKFLKQKKHGKDIY
jgi:hypothetical protein